MLSFIWQFNYYNGGNRLLRGLLNSWSVSPIMTVHSGLPFTITSGGTDFNFDGITGNDRPIRIPGSSVAVANPGPAQWFNTAAFCANTVVTTGPCAGLVGIGPNGQDGNVGRNSLRGPGFYRWDMSLFRDFRFRERLTLQVRAEALSVFNIVNLDKPGTTLGSTTFGVISTASTMRQLQLGLRLVF